MTAREYLKKSKPRRKKKAAQKPYGKLVGIEWNPLSVAWSEDAWQEYLARVVDVLALWEEAKHRELDTHPKHLSFLLGPLMGLFNQCRQEDKFRTLSLEIGRAFIDCNESRVLVWCHHRKDAEVIRDHYAGFSKSLRVLCVSNVIIPDYDLYDLVSVDRVIYYDMGWNLADFIRTVNVLPPANDRRVSIVPLCMQGSIEAYVAYRIMRDRLYLVGNVSRGAALTEEECKLGIYADLSALMDYLRN